jgi:hypothetical protein
VHYVSYLLELTQGQVLEKSVAYGPDPETTPSDGFAWKVVCDAAGKVLVRGMRDNHVRVIATARWNAGLEERCQIAADTPNDHQWAMIESTLRIELACVDAMEPKRSARDVPIENALIPDSDLESLEYAPETVSAERAAEIDARLAARKAAGAPQADPGPAKSSRRARKRAKQAEIIAGKDSVQAEVDRKFRIGMWILGVSTLGPIALVLLFVYVPCSGKKPELTKLTPPTPPAPLVAIDAPVPLTIDQRVAAATSLPEALALAQPISTTLVARYAVAKLKLAEVEAAETTLPLVEKDYRAELGKRLCVEGEVRRIERADMDQRKVFVGELLTKDSDRVTYLAVGSSGELVKRSNARFCGVVTGKLELVGMFDLPENRAPSVEQ